MPAAPPTSWDSDHNRGRTRRKPPRRDRRSYCRQSAGSPALRSCPLPKSAGAVIAITSPRPRRYPTATIPSCSGEQRNAARFFERKDPVDCPVQPSDALRIYIARERNRIAGMARSRNVVPTPGVTSRGPTNSVSIVTRRPPPSHEVSKQRRIVLVEALGGRIVFVSRNDERLDRRIERRRSDARSAEPARPRRAALRRAPGIRSVRYRTSNKRKGAVLARVRCARKRAATSSSAQIVRTTTSRRSFMAPLLPARGARRRRARGSTAVRRRSVPHRLFR